MGFLVDPIKHIIFKRLSNFHCKTHYYPQSKKSYTFKLEF